MERREPSFSVGRKTPGNVSLKRERAQIQSTRDGQNLAKSLRPPILDNRRPLSKPTATLRLGGGNRSSYPNPAIV